MSSVSDTTPCKVCQKTSGPETKLSTCAKCKVPTYCGRDCQAKNWPAHKRYCGGPWWDNFRVRKCRDGSLHEGKPELITGSTPANLESDDYSEDTGWGGTPEEDVDYLKSQFEGEMQYDELKLYKKWPQAFRWTCCGLDGGNNMGYDYHGTGSKPCTCDFCKMGQPLTEKIHNKRLRSQAARGLELQRGPDPRSHNARSTGLNAAMRGVLGMDD